MAKVLQDRNFDKLVDKFEQKVYCTVKGKWRLKLLKEDLKALQQGEALDIWDAGCGFAQMSQWFAKAGHNLTLCDLSHQMLLKARQNFEFAELNASFIEGAAQDIAPSLPLQDLVMFHAVMEWLAEPKETLGIVAKKVKPNGYLSLLFYNRNSVVINNTLKGSWRLPYLLNDEYIGKGKKLTPPNPQIPEEVCQWLEDLNFEIKIHTGIRVFHDYMAKEAIEQSSLQDLMDLEYRYCRTPTFRNMARYIHILAKRREN